MAGSGPRVWDAHYLDGRTPIRYSARVSIGAAGLEITLVETGTSFRWPLAEVRQTQGFYAGEQVRLERGGDLAETLLVRDLAFLTALRAAAPQAAAAFHDPARRRFHLVAALLAAVSAVAVAAGLYVWGIPAIAALVADRVPVAWETTLGEAAITQLAPPARRCVDPERQARIDEVVGVLVRGAPPSRYPIRVAIANNSAVNAFAAPGGFVVVFRGLLDRTESAEELAGVLAHEIQHVVHRHATRAIIRQASTGVLIAALVGDVTGVMAYGLESARLLGDMRHSREAEREADRDGLRMLQAAAVDPEGMLAFFRTMQKLQGSSPALVGYLSTHPAPGDRLQELTAMAAARPRLPVKLLPGYDWSDIKKICARRAR